MQVEKIANKPKIRQLGPLYCCESKFTHPGWGKTPEEAYEHWKKWFDYGLYLISIYKNQNEKLAVSTAPPLLRI